jgi:hypothetical protein
MTRMLKSVLSALLITCSVSGIASFARGAETNETSRFIQSNGGEFMLVYHWVGPMFGGIEVFLNGNGTVEIRRIRPIAGGMEEVRYGLVDLTRVQAIKDLMTHENTVAMNPNSSLGPELDAGTPYFTFRNGAAEVREFEPQSELSTPFADLATALNALEATVVDQRLLYQGPVQNEYCPTAFQWAQSALQTRQHIGWAPAATEEEMQQSKEQGQKQIEEFHRMQQNGREKGR